MSKTLEIQRHLAKGLALTPLAALRRFGCLSLSQRVGELKRKGFPIQTKLIKVNGSRVAKYWIDTERVTM